MKFHQNFTNVTALNQWNDNCSVTALLSRKLFQFYALKVRSHLLLRCKISLANSMIFFIAICAIESFTQVRKSSPSRFCSCSSWSREFAMLTNRKLLCLKVTTVWAVLYTSLHYWQKDCFCPFTQNCGIILHFLNVITPIQWGKHCFFMSLMLPIVFNLEYSLWCRLLVGFISLKLVKPLNLHDDALWSHWNVVHDVKKDNRDYRCSAKFNLQFIYSLFFDNFARGNLQFSFFFCPFSLCARNPFIWIGIHSIRNFTWWW